MAVYASQLQPEVPPEREGYVRYVLTANAEVPQGEPITRTDPVSQKPLVVAASNRFHRAGDIVSVHNGFKPALTWRVYEPPKES